MESNLPILLFLVPFLSAMLAAIVGWFFRNAARRITLASLAATAGVSVYALVRVLEEGSLHTHMGGWPPPIGIEVLLDPLSAVLAVVVSFVGLVVVGGAVEHTRAELPRRKLVYYSSVLLLMSGLMGITITGDLFNLFVQIEVASLSAYALVAAGGRGAPRAALNYLVIGSLGASLYLIGVGFIYAATGSLNMAHVVTLVPDADPRLVLVGGILMVGGLATKMGLFPFHVWMPAAYSRAPSAAATFMAPLVTKVSAYALLRILFWVFAGGAVATEVLLGLVAWSGAAAAVLGGVLAFMQRDLRRLLAYSSVGQMGVVALGAGLANTAGLTGAILHIANDALMKGALFLAAGIALVRFGVRNVDDLSRLRGRAPWTMAVMVVAGLSLVGIPPLSGFFGKWYVLSGALEAEHWVFVAALAVGSLASVGYTFRFLEPLFFGPVPAPPAPGEPVPREGGTGALVACVVLALAIIVLGVANERLVTLFIVPALPGVAP
jgi:multicomponent Na+:H+ antiporter subunit D